MKMITITTDGRCNLIDEKWELVDFNTFVDGWIESLTLPDGHSFIVNEEGKIIGFDINDVATNLAAFLFEQNPSHMGFYDVIVGNCVLVGPTDRDGNSTDVSDSIVDLFKERGLL